MGSCTRKGCSDMNYTELEGTIERISSVFDMVKIVDPIEGKEFVLKDGEVITVGNCFESFGKTSKCVICPCVDSVKTGRFFEKYECMGDKVLQSNSYPVKFTDKNGVEYDLALDLINILPRELFVKNIQSHMMVDNNIGIPNLAGFMDRLVGLIMSGAASGYDAMFFNIHNFKFITNIFSHEEGNGVILQYAVNIMKTLEKDEMLARVGGDNFVALVRRENSAKLIKLLGNVEVTVSARNGRQFSFNFSAKIGAAELDKDIHVPGEVMQKISVAYQTIKRRKDIDCIYFSPELFSRMVEMQQVIYGFGKAIHDHEFVVYYQPKVELETNRIIGAEALVRWQMNGSIISPGVFVPTLEKESKICELDYYVLEEVCKMLQKWKNIGRELVCISANFSRKHLDDPYFVDKVLEIVDKYSIEHEYIEIELTESEEFSDYATMSNFVDKFRKNGFKTSIDDFGTGYSTMKMLQKTSLDIVKIDRSFIPLSADYPEKEKTFRILKEMIRLTSDLGMKVIAEGVEDKIQLGYLKDTECNYVQGYVFDKPLPEDEFEKRVDARYYD